MKNRHPPAGVPNREPPDADESSKASGPLRSQARVINFPERARAGVPAADEKALSQVPMLSPEDTGTRQALREAATGGTAVWYAVQLHWSAVPIELSDIRRDPIFSSYTVYTTRACRNGREWFELRLGFFRDADSAKQVAYYLRREFNSPAVVPVSPREHAAARTAASTAKGRGAASGMTKATASAASDVCVSNVKSRESSADESAAATPARLAPVRRRQALRWWRKPPA